MVTSLMAKRLAQVRDSIRYFRRMSGDCFSRTNMLPVNRIKAAFHYYHAYQPTNWCRGDAEYTAVLCPNFSDETLLSMLEKYGKIEGDYESRSLEKWVLGVSAAEVSRQLGRPFQLSRHLHGFQFFLGGQGSPHIDEQLLACWVVHQGLIHIDVLKSKGHESGWEEALLRQFLRRWYTQESNTLGYSLQGLSDQDQERINKIYPPQPVAGDATLYFRKGIDELELTIRSINCLMAADVLTIGQLIRLSDTELLRIPNFGRKGLLEIKEVLEQGGLSLR